MIKSSYSVVALMSGTSLDGVDLVYVNFFFENKWTFNIQYGETYPYNTKWKHVLNTLTQKSPRELTLVDEAYSKHLAEIVLRFINSNSINNIDFIASHGHTALHQPEKGLTYQIGNQQILADLLHRQVICDFRVQDVKLGGQGAPLVPIGDRLLFGNYEYCLNLGGFANISFESHGMRIAYDICPVNIVLNHYVSKLSLEYDDKGHMASSGKINYKLLNSLNELDFYSANPPKSLGLEWVETSVFTIMDSFELEIKDILRTFVEHIAVQIAKVLKKENAQVLVSGGGTYNAFLIERLNRYSTSEIVIPSKDIIEFKEALIFGLLGVLKSRNEVNCLASVTGASQDHSSGKVLEPKIKLK